MAWLGWCGSAQSKKKNTYLYKYGDEYSDVTGGWSNNGWMWNASSALPSATVADQYLSIGESQGLGTQMKIDLTDIAYIRVKADVTKVDQGTCNLTINSDGKYYYQGGNPVIYTNEFRPTGIGDFYFDVSSYSGGQWYIGLASPGSNRAMKVYEIELIPVQS